MTAEQFCFWLHGFFELTGKDAISSAQAKMIREHLDLLFDKKTPPLDRGLSKEGKDALDELLKHDRPGMTCTGGNIRIC